VLPTVKLEGYDGVTAMEINVGAGGIVGTTGSGYEGVGTGWYTVVLEEQP